MTMYVFKIISLLGGLALFLFGMDVMGKSLERLAGGKLQTLLAKMSSTVFRGLLLGMAVTAVIQSSSATTVMVVGFVNSGIMTLKQAIGVIMGSNIGTTITSWILSLSSLEGDSFIVQIFKPTTLAPMLGTIGIMLFMFTKSEKKQGIGTILLGFLALMTGMDMMSSSMEFLKEEVWFANLMISFSNPLLGILAGAVLTGIIQSSSASVGILQGLCATGTVTMGTALPIILGQNIGTCVTAMISTVGANRNARRTALVHLYFNIVGVALFVIVFYGIGLFFPWKMLDNTAGAMDIALIHTGFNLVTTLVLLPLHGVLEKLAYLTIPDDTKPEEEALLDSRLLGTPAVAVQRAQEIAGRMATSSHDAMKLAMGLTKSYDPAIMDKVRKLEEETDKYQDALGTYLVQLSSQMLSGHDNYSLNTLLYTINDMERIADHAVSIAKAGKEMHDKKINFSDSAKAELAVLERAVHDILDYTTEAFINQDLHLATKIEPVEQVVDGLVREVKSRHVRRLRDGKCSVNYGFVLDDMLTSYERVADHCSNIAVEMLQSAEGRMDAHGYLGALKAGELDESAKYEERFAAYKARYTFPNEKD